MPVFVSKFPYPLKRVVCEIGGFKEVREAILESKANVIATRRKMGVLLFGSDQEAKKAFSKFGIQEFDLHTLLPDKIKYSDSQELGLLYEALMLAIQREISLRIEKKQDAYFVVVPEKQVNAVEFQQLKKAVFQLTGQVPNTKTQWAEAIRIRLEYKLDKLWLLITPTIWLDRPKNVNVDELNIADEFVRERRATRYNNKLSNILDAWIKILVGDSDTRKISSYGVVDGVDASFEISRGTGFSYKE